MESFYLINIKESSLTARLMKINVSFSNLATAMPNAIDVNYFVILIA